MPYRATGGRRRPFDFMSPLYGGTCSHVEANEKTRHGIEWSGSATSGSRGRVLSIPGLANVLTSDTQGGSPVPKSGSLGSVRGASSNVCPYREKNCGFHLLPPNFPPAEMRLLAHAAGRWWSDASHASNVGLETRAPVTRKALRTSGRLSPTAGS